MESEAALSLAALPREQGEEQRSNEGEAVPEAPIPMERDENEELREQIEDLRRSLDDAERRNADLSRERAELEAEMERLRLDYAERERALELRVQGEEERAREEGRLQGEAEGREAGHAEGLRTAKIEVEALYLKKLGGLVSLLESIAARLEEDFSELAALNQPRMLRLWFDMLGRMLKREVELKPDAVLPVLADVLMRLSDKSSVVIYVSPEDIALLQNSLDQEFEEVLRGVRHLELKPDASVDRGSCIVETGLGVYDARWRTQIEQIESSIEKLFQKLGKPAKRSSAHRRKGEETEGGMDAASSLQSAETRKWKAGAHDASDKALDKAPDEEALE